MNGTVLYQEAYKTIDTGRWQTEEVLRRRVHFNKGSIAVAEKTGFLLHNTYDSFAPFAPVENLTDLSEQARNGERYQALYFLFTFDGDGFRFL